jgi:DNA (cytosine-5)-methyltransferase 1
MIQTEQISQLSLFTIEEKPPVKILAKQANLSRYKRLQQQLESQEIDPHKIFIDINNPEKPLLNYTFVDLFSGAGGITTGLTKAGFKPIASVEINPIASATYRRNFPNCHHFCGDIEQFNWHNHGQEFNHQKVNLVVGGPPCQGFSLAGKRDPNDPRNILFKQFIRVVNDIKPWYVVMENVPGILTMKKGEILQDILESFREIGYKNISVMILESASYGIAQIRPRAIFIANRFNLPNPFPQPQLSPSQYHPIESVIADLPEWKPIPEINHEWTKHSKEFMQRIAEVAPGCSLYKSYADAFKRQYLGKPSMTVKENHGGTHIHPYLNRVISAREMARLQSFPDTFIFEGTMKKALWQIGNAVPPRLAECIGYALIPYLNKIVLTNNLK